MPVPAQNRIAAAVAYAGLAPVLWLLPAARRQPFVRHHTARALGVLAVLAVLLLLFAVAVVVVSVALVQYRTLYEDWHAEGWTLLVFRKLFLAWAVFPCFGAVLALSGRDWDLPGITHLGQSRWCRRAVLAFFLAVYALLPATAGLAIHATRHAAESGPAPVYLLYDNTVPRPRWLFALGFYPIVREARRIYGSGAAVVSELDADNLADALAHGRFVFLAAHGEEEGLLLEGRWFSPEEAAALPKSGRLTFVYLAGCDSGAQADAWRSALAPAEVVTYDRLTAMLEHLWWIWRHGPRTLRRVAGDTETAM